MTTVCLFFTRLEEQGTEAAWERGLRLACLCGLSQTFFWLVSKWQLVSEYSFLMHATHTNHNIFT